MKNDLSQSSVTVFAERRKNKSIWLRSCMIVALVVVVLTSYALIFPARTVEKELICGRAEHVHDGSCWLVALSCGLEEGEDHTHTDDCWTKLLVCGMEEHVHTDACYAEPEPQPELTRAPETTEEPIVSTEPEEPAPTETEEPLPTEPGEPVVTEPEEPGETEPAVTEPEDPGETQPAATEPEDPGETELPEEPVVTEPIGSEFIIRVVTVPAPVASERPDYVFPEEGIDLAPYLDSAIFQRQEGGVFVEDTWFENGETAKAAIVYDIPKNTVTPENRYVYYQLPEGIQPIEETSGEVMDEGVPVGVYTITEDGRIHILFNEDFANGNAIMGTVEFSSYLYANDDGSDRVIEFENDAGTITITVPDVQRYDLSLEKTGEFGDDYSWADYCLTVSTDKGTGAPISITDQLTNQTPATLLHAAYSQSVFSVTRIGADGSRTDVSDFALSWSQDGMGFTIPELPALEAGEKYEILYRVNLEPDLSASFELDNDATAVAGELEATTTFFISYTCDVTKSGTFNPITGLIDWVITVNPESRPVAGWRIEDTLPYPAVGKVILSNANGVRYADLTPTDGRTISYVFPPNAPAKPYFIRYSTTAPTTAETVRNTVRLINDRETIVVSEVTVDERSEGVDKTLGSKHVFPDGMVRTNWSFHVTLPVGELNGYSFRDNISTPVMDVNDGEYLDNNLHFGYAAELEQALRGNLRLISDGTAYYYGDEANTYVDFVLTYYDSQGNVVEPTDTETHVSRVVFELVPLRGNSFHGYEVVAEDYPTWLDARAAQEGDYWSYQNYIYLRGGVYDVALAFHRKGKAFEKQVNVNGHFSSDEQTLYYEDFGGELEYRLLLDLSAVADGDLTVTDLLPAGTELIPNSVRVFYTGVNYHGEYDGTFANADNFHYTTAPAADGKTQLTFTATGITDQMKQTYAYIGIVYSVRLTDESLWNDYTHASETFTNVATWDDYTATESVTVINEPKRVWKNGVQLTDEEGNPSNRLRFSVLINAGAEDLNPESAWITLTDSFSSAIGANLELGSVKLYRYDPTKPDNLGNRVMPYDFGLSFDPTTKTMTVTLLDETAYVLVYEYTVDFTAILDGQTGVGNRAVLEGLFESTTSFVLRGVSSSATAWQRVITITKVDADNYAKVLPGALFQLEYWDPEHGVWAKMANEDNPEQYYETNESGKIILTLIGSEKDLFVSTLYRFTEIRPPVGYDDDHTVVWFVCLPRGDQTAEEVFAEAGAGSGVNIDQVSFYGQNGGAAVIPNPFSGLTVNKRWFTPYGEEMVEPDKDPITVTLYRTTDPTGATGMVQVPATEKVENPIQLGGDNNWTYTWGDLPSCDENGNDYFYYVAEDPVPGYTPVYINNGITGGIIAISNNCEPYQLPKTGSVGNSLFVGIGVLLMLAVVIVYVIKFNKRMEDKQ